MRADAYTDLTQKTIPDQMSFEWWDKAGHPPLSSKSNLLIQNNLLAESDKESCGSSQVPDLNARAEDDPATLVEDSDADQNEQAVYPLEKLKLCGRLPMNCDPGAFLGKPANIDKTRRSAEGNYSRDYDRIATDAGVSSPALPSKPIALEKDVSLVKGNLAKVLDGQAHQRRLFKKLDDYRFEIDTLFGSSTASQTSPGEEDVWLHAFRTSTQDLRSRFPADVKSHTVAYDAAAFLIRQGLLNVKGTPHVNVKQARALLHFTGWLQDYLSQQWIQDKTLMAPSHQIFLSTLFHALIGGPGTGKTTTTKVIKALLEHFIGPDCMPQSAPTNTAARLLGGDTVDAMYKLPRGSLLSERGGQLSDRVLKGFRRKWKGAVAHNIDEISMLAPNKAHQLDHRCRLATMRFEEPMGGLATNGCVDFLQLPPVDTPSIAMPLEQDDYDAANDLLGDGQVAETEKEAARRDAKWAEMRFGCRLWREQFRTVTCLTLNMRTKGILKDILAEMRLGKLSDASWHALQSRVLGVQEASDGSLQPLPKGSTDPRMLRPPFSDNPVTYIVHRHNLRVCQSYCNAVRASLLKRVRLYVSIACDEPASGNRACHGFTEDVRAQLLRENNLRKLQYLPSVVPLYVGMHLLLYSKECVRLHLMNGCEVILEQIFCSDKDEEDMPDYAAAGAPIFLQYMPVCLLLRAVGAEWTLPASMLPHFLDNDYNRKGLFLLYPDTKYLKIPGADGNPVKVRRTHFPVVPADTRIVYAAQGEGFTACVADMASIIHWSFQTRWARGQDLDLNFDGQDFHSRRGGKLSIRQGGKELTLGSQVWNKYFCDKCLSVMIF